MAKCVNLACRQAIRALNERS